MPSQGQTTSGWYTTNDGVHLHYLEAGQGPPLVMLPGWTQPASGFAGQFAAFSGAYRCLALDYRGHGESDRPNHGHRVSRLARDCLDFLDHFDLEDVVLLGHSAGCAVIWAFVDLFGEDRVHGLVLCDQPITFFKRPDWSEAQCRQYGASVDANDALARAAELTGSEGKRVMREFLVSMFSDDFPESQLQQVLQGSLNVSPSMAADLMLSVMKTDFRDILPRISRPTLCIGGTRSHLGPEVMPWIASRIPGGKIAMIDARHFVHLERPDSFNEAVRTFLGENA